MAAAAMDTSDDLPPLGADHRPLAAPGTERLTVEEKYSLLPAFLQLRGLFRHHIDSFNYFVNTEIKEIVRANSRVTCDADASFYLEYTNVEVKLPSLEDGDVISRVPVTPNQCRLRDQTYAADIVVNVEYVRGSCVVVRDNVLIGRLPIMLRSSHCVLNGATEGRLAEFGECPNDSGGYFIVRGQEKVILIQEQLSKNRVIIERDKKDLICASITSSTHERKSRTSLFQKAGKIYLKHNTLSAEIPIIVVFRAMGMQADLEILDMVGPEYAAEMLPSMEEAIALGVNTTLAAVDYLNKNQNAHRRAGQPTPAAAGGGGGGGGGGAGGAGGGGGAAAAAAAAAAARPAQDETRELLASVILSHVPVVNFNFRPKCLFLAMMVRRMFIAMRTGVTDDKDYYGNKRLEMAGQLLALLFEDLFKSLNTQLRKHATTVLARRHKGEAFDVIKWIRADTITNGMIRAISTGNWTLKRFKMTRAGVTQVVSRLSYIACLGMMTRISSQFEKTRKVSGPRALQGSQYGIICPSDTPEGESCGLVKNLALLTHVTTEEAEGPVITLARSLGVQDSVLVAGSDIAAAQRGAYLVFVNGTIIGLHCQPNLLLDHIRAMRRAGRLAPYISVFTSDEQRLVSIATDAGRLCRPLLVVRAGRPLVTSAMLRLLARERVGFDDFVRGGVIEYLDVNEENSARIALYEDQIGPDTTHLEIEPLSFLGVCAGLIPYPHHNQSPRNTYQCAMGKQAMGAIAFNQQQRIDTLLYLLVYPQKPLVRTRTIEIINFNDLSAGQNASVCVMSYSGYDIEDAIVMNRASIDRGFGRAFVLRKHSTSMRQYPNQAFDRIVCPANDPRADPPRRAAKDSLLDGDGIIGVGAYITQGKVMVNKQSPVATTAVPGGAQPVIASVSEFRSTPVAWKSQIPGVIDQVLLTANANSTLIVKILARSFRRPEVGDKFSSRHGQKGVVGLIVDQEDMPFNDRGVCPDLIMNPHGFPSRMTVGKMIELLGGKAGVLGGKFGYGTAFGGDKVEAICEVLVAHGYSYSGKDYFTSGITGEPQKAYVFAGPIFYQKLKHQVTDKMHARARGPRAVLTRQPTEGRSKEGGLRLGEMERDCLIAYGASALLMERLMTSSDSFEIHVCRQCGLIGYKDWCQFCRAGDTLSRLWIPYAAKLLFQELQSMNIVPRLGLE